MSAAATVIEVNAEREHEDDFEAMGVGDRDGQFRDWFFTVNSPSDDLKARFWDIASSLFGEIRGGVYQREFASREHLQGCFKLVKKCRPITMKNKIRSRHIMGWIKPCVDTEKAIAYCTKDDTRIEEPVWFGAWTEDNQGRRDKSTQGRRTDLAKVADDVDAGKSLSDVAKAHPTAFIKYHGGIQQYMTVTKSLAPRDFMTQLHIYWGAPGTGKTRRAWHEASSYGRVYELPVAKEANVIWWPGYDGQECVVMDDYYGWFPFHQLLKMVDRYEWKVRTQGDNFTQFRSRHIFITSNSSWQTWYQQQFMKEGHWKAAFERRITDCVEFKEGVVWSPDAGSSAAASSPAMLSAEPDMLEVYRAERDRIRGEVLDDIDRNASPLTIDVIMSERHKRMGHGDNCDCDAFASMYFTFYH